MQCSCCLIGARDDCAAVMVHLQHLSLWSLESLAGIRNIVITYQINLIRCCQSLLQMLLVSSCDSTAKYFPMCRWLVPCVRHLVLGTFSKLLRVLLSWAQRHSCSAKYLSSFSRCFFQKIYYRGLNCTSKDQGLNPGSIENPKTRPTRSTDFGGVCRRVLQSIGKSILCLRRIIRIELTFPWSTVINIELMLLKRVVLWTYE